MRQYTYKEFTNILKRNNYYLKRINGSHCIFINSTGRHICVPKNRINNCIARRLIKQNNLI